MNSSYVTPKYFEDPRKIIKLLTKHEEEYWINGTKENAFRVFELLKIHVPAYKKFLKSKGLNIENIKTNSDLHKLPIMTKENYLNKHSFQDLLNGKVENIKSFYMSSGSSGKPGIWPRLESSNLAYSIFVNFFYTLFWNIDIKKTLYVSAMDLGIWASGNLQFHAATYCASRHNFTFANPGADLNFIYHILKDMSHYYDQVIIATYPSWARRILDFLQSKEDLDVKKLNIRFMLGGEPHTIEWRHYILSNIGLSKDNLIGVMDYYGTSDSGGPGVSTPLSSLIQNLCFKDKKLCYSLFGQTTVPSLFQQNPTIYVESVDNKIIVTFPGQLPLCRYDSGDTGGVLKFSEVASMLKRYGYDLDALLKKKGYGGLVWKWPFVYLTGRYDLAVSIGGAVIYPKDIEGLFFKNESREINSFKLAVESDQSQKYTLKIYLELKPDLYLSPKEKIELSSKYKKIILKRLIDSNLDYAAAYDMDKESCEPTVLIINFQQFPFEDDIKRPKSLFVKK